MRREWVQSGLAAIAPTFRFGPVLVDPQHIRMPLATDLNGMWVWDYRSAASAWARVPRAMRLMMRCCRSIPLGASRGGCDSRRKRRRRSNHGTSYGIRAVPAGSRAVGWSGAGGAGHPLCGLRQHRVSRQRFHGLLPRRHQHGVRLGVFGRHRSHRHGWQVGHQISLLSNLQRPAGVSGRCTLAARPRRTNKVHMS